MKKKPDTRFPVARIKKIMQADDEVGKIAQATPVLISKAMELFLQDLCNKTYQITVARGAKTIGISHLKACVMSNAVYDFLRDIVSQPLDVPSEASVDDRGFPAVRRPSEGLSEDSGSEKEDVKRLRRESVADQRRGRGRGRGGNAHGQPESGQSMVACDGTFFGYEYRPQPGNGRISGMVDCKGGHMPVDIKPREKDDGIMISQTAPRLVPSVFPDGSGSGSSYCLSDPFFTNEFHHDSQKLVGSLPSDHCLRGSGFTGGFYSDVFHMPPQRLVGSLPTGRSQFCLTDRFRQEWVRNRNDGMVGWFSAPEQPGQPQTSSQMFSSRMCPSGISAERLDGRKTSTLPQVDLFSGNLQFERLGDGGCTSSTAGNVNVVSGLAGNVMYIPDPNVTATNGGGNCPFDHGQSPASGASCELVSSPALKREPRNFDLNMDVDRVDVPGMDSNAAAEFNGKGWGTVTTQGEGLNAHQDGSRGAFCSSAINMDGGAFCSSAINMDGREGIPVLNFNRSKCDGEDDYDNYDEDEKH